jgi:hypothetical protein
MIFQNSALHNGCYFATEITQPREDQQRWDNSGGDGRPLSILRRVSDKRSRKTGPVVLRD